VAKLEGVGGFKKGEVGERGGSVKERGEKYGGRKLKMVKLFHEVGRNS